VAYNEELAGRVSEALCARDDVSERKMFGGLSFMVNGKMALGVSGDDLMVKVGPDAHGEALKLLGAREMDFTGRPMKGFVFVGPQGTELDSSLQSWIDRAVEFAASTQ
jgi:TfoX/Sxy family transcriptional regulator of competence genes